MDQEPINQGEQAWMLPDGKGVVCRVCGATLTFTFPVRIGPFAAMVKAFATAHHNCQATPIHPPATEARSNA